MWAILVSFSSLLIFFHISYIRSKWRSPIDIKNEFDEEVRKSKADLAKFEIESRNRDNCGFSESSSGEVFSITGSSSYPATYDENSMASVSPMTSSETENRNSVQTIAQCGKTKKSGQKLFFLGFSGQKH